MTHHVTQIVTELGKNGGYLMAFGTCSLPGLVEWFVVLVSALIVNRFLRLVVRFEFVKYALLDLGAAHLNCLVKLTELERLG